MTGAPVRLGLALRDPLPWPEATTIVKAAERTGYEAVFVPEIAGREAFAALAGFAAATERIRLGSGVVTATSREARVAAMAAATIQEQSGGRMILGIGAGPPGPGSLDRLRGYVQGVRETWGSMSLRLDAPPPIWLAALGPKTMGFAGEVADGILLNWCPPERVAFAVERVREGAERSGRDPGAITVAVYVRACLGVPAAIALEALRGAAATYAAMPHYRRQLEASGLGEEASAAASAASSGLLEEVPERLVDAVAVRGDREDAAAAFDRYRRAGADVVVCYPVAAADAFSSVLGTVLTASPDPTLEH